MRSVALCAALALAGCAAPPLRPPEALLADCQYPSIDPSTNATLAQGVLDYHASLQSCNDDKAALRFFFERKLK